MSTLNQSRMFRFSFFTILPALSGFLAIQGCSDAGDTTPGGTGSAPGNGVGGAFQQVGGGVGAGGTLATGMGGSLNSVGGSSVGGMNTGGVMVGDAVGGSGVGGSNIGTDTGGSTSGGAGSGGQDGSGGSDNAGPYNPEFVEFYGEDCTVSDPQEVDNPKLPDLFESLDGTRISNKSDWACRRAEIKKSVEDFIHGEKPGRPEMVTGTVSAGSVSVSVTHGGKTINFSATINLPGMANGPVPAIIGIGGSSLDGPTLAAEGVATINFGHSALAAEGSRNGLFTDIYGQTGASAQVGWAWGVSRIIDVLVDERDAGRNDIIDPTGIGVTGCSRLGKGAFTVGAFDERIALGIPQESGTGGVSAFRVVNTNPGGPNGQSAQTLQSAWSEAAGWFGTVFEPYVGNANAIPADTHSLVAMYAPRGLLVLDNSRIGELGASAQHAASAAGGEVFKALGVEKNIEYHGGNSDDPHNHCAFYESQREPLIRAIRAHLTRTEEPDGRIAPAPVATADLAEWIDWDTPTLN